MTLQEQLQTQLKPSTMPGQPGGAPMYGSPGGQIDTTQPVKTGTTPYAPPTYSSPGGQIDTTQPVKTSAPAAAPVGGGVDTTQPVPGGPQLGSPGGATVNAPPAKTGGPVGVNDALNQVQLAAQARLGRHLRDDELQVLYQQLGLAPGLSTVSQDQLQQGLGLVNKYSGDLANPWGPITPGGPTQPGGPSTGPVDPGITTNQNVQQILQQLMGTGQSPAWNTPPDMNNPAFDAQRANFDRANAMATTRQRLSAAERRAADNTLGAGGFDADIAGAETSAGDRKAQFESDLYRGELQDQRQRASMALELATRSGDASMQRAMVERLAMLDHELKKQSITSQTALGKGNLMLGLLQALMGDQRAKDALGFNYTQLGANNNLASLQAILNGLPSTV